MPDFNAAASTQHITEQLDAAWQQLAGFAPHFRQVASLDVNGCSGYYAMTPVSIPKSMLTGGIALNLPNRLANALAANLFAEPDSSINDEQRADVCAEFSNILCSCVTSIFGQPEEIELGLTRMATQETLRQVFDHREVQSIFTASTSYGDANLVVVNSFEPRATTLPTENHDIDVATQLTFEENTRMKFLIVDDSRAIQAIVRRAIEKSGLESLEFKTAANGEEALKTCETWLPDMVITDWHMPGMTGIELTKALRSKHAGLRIGFVTTESSSRNLDDAKMNGAAFVLRKPFVDDELIKAVLDALGPDKTALPAGALTRPGNDGLKSFLAQAAGIQVNIANETPIPLNAIKTPWSIGLYAESGKNDVRAFCLLDRNAMLILGAKSAGLSNDALAPSFNGGELPAPVAAKAGEILAKGAGILFGSDGAAPPINLARSQIVPQPPEKLIEIMNKNSGRTDYQVSRDNLPAGRIVIITR